jgi:hypothetical protein
MHATVAGASTTSPAHRWPSSTWRSSPTAAFPSGRHVPTPPRCCHAPTLRRSLPPIALAYPAPLTPARHACRRPGRAKPSAASDGGGGGDACATPALTPTPRITWPRALLCCKRMFQVFQMFRRYVSNVSCGCCNSRSGYCIYCNDCTRILQVSIPNVSRHML